jgi:hypothetical protein
MDTDGTDMPDLSRTPRSALTVLELSGADGTLRIWGLDAGATTCAR